MYTLFVEDLVLTFNPTCIWKEIRALQLFHGNVVLVTSEAATNCVSELDATS